MIVLVSESVMSTSSNGCRIVSRLILSLPREERPDESTVHLEETRKSSHAYSGDFTRFRDSLARNLRQPRSQEAPSKSMCDQFD